MARAKWAIAYNRHHVVGLVRLLGYQGRVSALTPAIPTSSTNNLDDQTTGEQHSFCVYKNACKAATTHLTMLLARCLRMTSNTAARVATAARHLSTTSAPAPKRVQRMTVFGAGLMGSGIVQVAAQAGIQVTIVDTSDRALE
jgi:xanthine/CO dehydrogenase XdhC/CoxF family maturation factor